MTHVSRFKKYGVLILRRHLGNCVPQTFPILLKSREIRDHLYFELNKRGIGAVSLYHQLIKEIDQGFSIEHELSDRILNLPIHQDIGFEELDFIACVLEELLTTNKIRRN
jgi:dTDP-4-amino-4,6-dideoxygalactose transaminase